MFKTTTNIGSVACCCWCCCLDADYCADSIRFYTFLNSYLGRFLFCTDFSFLFVFFFPFVVACFHRLKKKNRFFFLHVLSLVAFLASPYSHTKIHIPCSFVRFSSLIFIFLMLSISCLLFRQFRYTIFLSLLTCCLKTTRTRRRRTKNSST